MELPVKVAEDGLLNWALRALSYVSHSLNFLNVGLYKGLYRGLLHYITVWGWRRRKG